jgi:hypothetical protein
LLKVALNTIILLKVALNTITLTLMRWTPRQKLISNWPVKPRSWVGAWKSEYNRWRNHVGGASNVVSSHSHPCPVIQAYHQYGVGSRTAS